MNKLIFSFGLLSALVLLQASTISFDNGYDIGDTVEDFRLQNVDGSWIQFSEYMGDEGAVVIFTCNTCPYAQLYEDRINELHQKLSKEGFPVLAINPNDPSMKPGDSFEAMQSRSKDKSFTFPYAFDEKQEVFPKFGAKRTPHVFVVDKSMKLRYIGAIDDNPQDPDGVKTNYVTSAIDAIKAGKDPDPLTTKAIGCGIKSKSL